jgi:hypothetical protein
MQAEITTRYILFVISSVAFFTAAIYVASTFR